MQEITKEEIEKLMSLDIKARGVVLKTDSKYVLEKMGKAELKKVETCLEVMGHRLEYKKIEDMAFYPAGLRMLSLLAIKETFKLDEKEIKEMGFLATKKSAIVRVFAKYFVSVGRVFSEEAPRLWQKHWTRGTLNPIELNQEKKYAILRLEDFDLHPLYCSVYLPGYFSGILQMVVNTSQVKCEPTKCTFSLKGDDCHEYLLEWK